MLKYPCLVLDHDDTVVASESNINYPFFCYILKNFRPGAAITLDEYTQDCFTIGFSEMCRRRFRFNEEELVSEYQQWLAYIRTHIPPAYPGIREILHKQRSLGGKICVVSHSSAENITRDYRVHFDMEPDDIFGWDLPEALRKPSPYPLETILEKYSFRPEELLVVDDMRPGYEMAHVCGVPIAFSGRSRKDFPEISSQMKALCDFSFDTVSELDTFLFGSLDKDGIIE